MKPRPRYLNILKIHLPITGFISILHRISGILLFLFIPISLGLLQYSLYGQIEFQAIQRLLHTPSMIIVLLIFLLVLVQHFFAGIRFLLMDIGWGMDKTQSSRSAWFALGISVISSILILIGIY
jgi:succinate dehydrogenase / fumarate reductase cytochrome b subunit